MKKEKPKEEKQIVEIHIYIHQDNYRPQPIQSTYPQQPPYYPNNIPPIVTNSPNGF